jgi:hypothetical protein
LLEALNRIHQPTITRVGVQDADVHWLELDTSEAAAIGGPFPQIDSSEFKFQSSVTKMYGKCNVNSQKLPNFRNVHCITGNNKFCKRVLISDVLVVYVLFLYEGSPGGRLLTQKECPPLSSYNGVRLTRLKPQTDYHVSVQATLPERQLVGAQSPTAPFRTRGCSVPDAPQCLRFTQKGATFLAFSWVSPANNGGSPILNYVLQISKVSSWMCRVCRVFVCMLSY